QDDRWLAIKSSIATLQRWGKHDVGNLPHQDGLTTLCRQGQVFQVVELRRSAQVADQVFPAVKLEKPAGGVRRVALERRDHLLVSDAELCHACRVRLHLKLTHLATDGDDLGHT